MYIERTTNGKYNVMQISEPVFNELLLLLKTYARHEGKNLDLPPGISILPRLMKQERDCHLPQNKPTIMHTINPGI